MLEFLDFGGSEGTCDDMCSEKLLADGGSCRQSHVHERLLIEVRLEYSAVFHDEFPQLLNRGLGVAINLHRASLWNQSSQKISTHVNSQSFEDPTGRGIIRSVKGSILNLQLSPLPSHVLPILSKPGGPIDIVILRIVG